MRDRTYDPIRREVWDFCGRVGDGRVTIQDFKDMRQKIQYLESLCCDVFFELLHVLNDAWLEFNDDV